MGIENDNDYKNPIQEFKEYVTKNNSKVSDTIHDKIYTDIINYYNIEMDFQKKLNIQNYQEQKYDGFFVDKVWDDKWKTYSYYDIIKARCLQNNNINKDDIIKMIKEEQSKNNLNYDEVNDVENYIAKNEKEVYNSIINSNKSYVILNKKFLKEFNITTNIQPIPFYLSYQNISLIPPGQIKLNFKTNNNIITIYNLKINTKSLNKSMQEEQLEHYQSQKNLNLNDEKQIIYIKNLENILNDEKIKNKKLKSDVINLKNALQLNQNELISLKNQVQNLKNENDNLKFQLNNPINNYQMNQNNIINKLQEEMNILKYNIKVKDNEINNLKSKLLKFEPTINRNDIIVINFISTDPVIQYGISCTSEETFAEVEERLYKRFNDFRNTNNNFLCKGNVILRFKKISENRISDGDNVQLIKFE